MFHCFKLVKEPQRLSSSKTRIKTGSNLLSTYIIDSLRD